MFDNDEWQKRNISHLHTPEIGDYWHEMFCPVAIIVDLYRDHVVLCRKTVDVDASHWTWDASKLELVSRAEFTTWFRYGSMLDKTWCDVSEKSSKHIVEAIWPRDNVVDAA